MRRCLINLTRLGDLLQTQPVIHTMKQQGDEIALVCLENFAEAAGLLQGVDHLAALPSAAMLSGLARDWRLCASGLEQWLRAEHDMFAPESCINLTPTLSARLLSRLVLTHSQPHGQPEGFSLDEHGFGLNSTPWATYVQAVTLNRGCSPFNLVDGFRCMAGVDGVAPVYELKRPEAEAQAEMQRELTALAQAAGLTNHTGFVAFQLGASNDARRWPTSSFAALGRCLGNKAGLAPVLLGSEAEQALAARYFGHNGPGLDLTGRTDLPRLAAALRACKLLVTNDTGTMHLAAGLGVPVLAIFLATAQPWDTGPYRENLCCLEPRLGCHPCGFGTTCLHDGQCRQQITAEAVAALVLPWLESGTWSPAPEASAVARVWLTGWDDRSFQDLTSLSGDEHSDRCLWIRHQRRFYRQLLDKLAEKEVRTPPAAPGCSSSTDSAPLAPLSKERRERILTVLAHADGLLHLVAEQGTLVATRPLPKARQSFLATSERLGALLDASPDFVPLAHLWRAILQDSAVDLPSMLRFFTLLRQGLAALAEEIQIPCSSDLLGTAGPQLA